MYNCLLFLLIGNFALQLIILFIMGNVVVLLRKPKTLAIDDEIDRIIKEELKKQKDKMNPELVKMFSKDD